MTYCDPIPPNDIPALALITGKLADTMARGAQIQQFATRR